MASVVQMMLMIHMAKRFPFVASLFHKIFLSDFCPPPSFIVIFPFILSIISSPPFGTFWWLVWPWLCSSSANKALLQCEQKTTSDWKEEAPPVWPPSSKAVCYPTSCYLCKATTSCFCWRKGRTGKSQRAISSSHWASVPCLCLQRKLSTGILFLI